MWRGLSEWMSKSDAPWLCMALIVSFMLLVAVDLRSSGALPAMEGRVSLERFVPWASELHSGVAHGLRDPFEPVSAWKDGLPRYSDFTDGTWVTRDGVSVRTGSRLKESHVSSPTECRVACGADPACSAATYDHASGLCATYSDLGEPVEVPSARTMIRRDRRSFREMPMASFRSHEPPAGESTSGSADECRERCADTVDCAAANWRPSDRSCSLLRSVDGITTPVGGGERSYLRVSA